MSLLHHINHYTFLLVAILNHALIFRVHLMNRSYFSFPSTSTRHYLWFTFNSFISKISHYIIPLQGSRISLRTPHYFIQSINILTAFYVYQRLLNLLVGPLLTLSIFDHSLTISTFSTRFSILNKSR